MENLATRTIQWRVEVKDHLVRNEIAKTKTASKTTNKNKKKMPQQIDEMAEQPVETAKCSYH